MSTMQTAGYKQFGDPNEVLQALTMQQDDPGAGEVRIKILLSPVHNHDVLTISGNYGVKPSLPAIGGTEAVGLIDAVGAGVNNLKPGERVNVVSPGTWGEYLVAPATSVTPIPEAVSDELAAQLMAMPSSALAALNVLGTNPGEWIVINAANGAVGKVIAQVAAARNINVISLVRTPAAQKVLEMMAVQNVFVTETANWKEAIADAVGDGQVTGAIDMLGGAASRDLLNLVSDNATLLSFGSMIDRIMQIDVSDLIYKQTTIKGFWGLQFFQNAPQEETQAIKEELLSMATQGKLQLPMAASFSLDQAKDAMQAYFKARDGKIFFHA